MADRDAPNVPSDADPDNREVVVALAVRVLQTKGWIEEPYDELIDALHRLYDANPDCQIEVQFNGDLWHDMHAGRPGEYLAAAFENECQEQWEREEAERREQWEREEAERWNCPCGMTFALGSSKDAFHTLTADGLFEKAVSECPRCERSLAEVRSKHANGQLGFAF